MSDPFKVKRDYIKGMLYEVRRQYLHSDGTNSLVPPQDFMTKKQARTALKVKRDESDVVDNSYKNILIFKNQNLARNHEDGELNNRPIKKQENSKKAIKRKPAVIMIEQFSSTNKNDWTEEKIPGCQVWVNHNTGEVSSVCPWDLNENNSEKIEDEFHSGTGSIVYDGDEFGQFMNDLDRLAEMKISSNAKNAKK